MSAEQRNRTVLVVGGAGYIGSHTIVCLLESGYDIVVVDNLVNSCIESLNRVRRIANVAENRLKVFEVIFYLTFVFFLLINYLSLSLLLRSFIYIAIFILSANF